MSNPGFKAQQGHLRWKWLQALIGTFFIQINLMISHINTPPPTVENMGHFSAILKEQASFIFL